MLNSDTLQRFIFDDSNVRGELVHLNESYQAAIEQTDYPEKLSNLLGEAMSAAVLLTATIKFSGKLSIQLQGEGPLSILLVQATHDRKVRGMVKWKGEVDTLSFKALLGKAQMAITIEPEKGERYQGIVPLDGDSFSECLEHYFKQSEQLPTRIWLTADKSGAAGLLLQKLPGKQEKNDVRDWEHIVIFAETTSNDELLSLSNEDFLYRLYHAEKVRLFLEQPVEFECVCSKERCEKAVISLGEVEIRKLAEEKEYLVMTCEFCNACYTLDKVDLTLLEKMASSQ